VSWGQTYGHAMTSYTLVFMHSCVHACTVHTYVQTYTHNTHTKNILQFFFISISIINYQRVSMMIKTLCCTLSKVDMRMKGLIVVLM